MAPTDSENGEETEASTENGEPSPVEKSSSIPPQDNYEPPVGTYFGPALPSPASLRSLQTAQDDLLFRSEVSATLQEMLSDIETAHTLSTELNHHNEVHSLQSQLEAARNALEEERAVREEQEERWAEEAKRRAELGDKFVSELVRLSAEMVELERWREENRGKVEEHGDLKDELKRSEDVIKKLKESAAAAAAQAAAEAEAAAAQEAADAVSEVVGPGAEEKTQDELLAEEEERELQAALAASLAEAEREKEARETKEEEEEKEGVKKVEREDEEQVKKEQPEENIKAETAAEPKAEEVEQEESKFDSQPAADKGKPKAEEALPELGTMPEYALMRIFGYLEAFDILSTAQVNVTLYSRVDLLFGLGGSIGEPTAAQSGAEGGGDVSDGSEDKKPSGSSSVSTKSDSKPAPAAAPSRSATRVAIPAPSPAPATKVAAAPAPAAAPVPSATTATGATAQPRIGGVGGGLTTMFSQLRSKAQQKPSDGESLSGGTAATASTLTTTTGAGAGSGGGGSGNATATGTATATATAAASSDATPGLNAAMASSMASKLTAAELAVIISMQTKLRHKDGELNQLRAEKDDVAAKLLGVESVKEFLITKVRDAEKMRKDGQDELAKIARQVASDQEVIAFLDGRVQELERTLKIAEDGKAEADGKLSQLRNQGSQKVRVLSDMLQFEKEQLAESEREWKTQKKVLVKEVKSCRAQIVALQAERDGFYEQNGKLKEALLKFNGGGSGSPGRLTKR